MMSVKFTSNVKLTYSCQRNTNGQFAVLHIVWTGFCYDNLILLCQNYFL